MADCNRGMFTSLADQWKYEPTKNVFSAVEDSNISGAQTHSVYLPVCWCQARLRRQPRLLMRKIDAILQTDGEQITSSLEKTATADDFISQAALEQPEQICMNIKDGELPFMLLPLLRRLWIITDALVSHNPPPLEIVDLPGPVDENGTHTTRHILEKGVCFCCCKLNRIMKMTIE